MKLNWGSTYGFSQVGKFITVYPDSAAAAVRIARDLDRLTRGLAAPEVPYDQRLRSGSCVYYRYGAFTSIKRMRDGKKRVPAMRTPDGTLVPDRRQAGAAVPPWMDDPFRGRTQPESWRLTPLETDYEEFKAVVQRGRGGVYRARDVAASPARDCFIKEGRRHGGTDWRGIDGYSRMQNEARCLRALAQTKAAVPRVYKTFHARGTFHLVIEALPGSSLHSVIVSRAKISRQRVLTLCRDMSRVLADIHLGGWIWGDCKPANFLCGRRGHLYALDFEGSFRAGVRFAPQSRTPGYVPPTWDAGLPQAVDLFALGVSVAQLVQRSARPPKLNRGLRRRGKWIKFPPDLAELTRLLIDPKPARRPPAREIQRRLEAMLAAEPR